VKPPKTNVNDLNTGKTQIPSVGPDFRGLDSAQEILEDVKKMGLLEDLLALLGKEIGAASATERLRIVRDIVYELAGSKDRDLSVDVLVFASGIAEFASSSLEDVALRHDICREWFSQRVEAVQRRLNLPPLSSQRTNAAREVYRLSNRRNHAA